MPIRTVKKTTVPSLAVVGFLVDKDPTELMQRAEDLAVETYNRLDSELDACVNLEAVFRHCIEAVSYREIQDFHAAIQFEVEEPRVDLDKLIFHYETVKPTVRPDEIPYSLKVDGLEKPTRAKGRKKSPAIGGINRK
jgi:hypothetical protein